MTSLSDTTFTVYGLDGNPIAGLAAGASWVGPYDVRTGAAATAPAISDLGGGQYSIAPTEDAHIAGWIDFGATAEPSSRWQFYDSQQSETIVFGLRSAVDWSPLSGLAPGTWLQCLDIITLAAVSAPTVREAVAGSAVYAVANMARPGQHLAGLCDFGETALQRLFHYDASREAEPHTLPSASQQAAVEAANATGDIGLEWSNESGSADLSVELNDLARDQGLRTAVMLSLFTDRRAEDGDVLPDGETDRRGWWADALPVAEGDRVGSRLWMLERAKPAEWLERAPGYAREALQWMVEDQLAEKVEATADVSSGRKDLAVAIYRPQQKEPTRFRFEDIWRAESSR